MLSREQLDAGRRALIEVLITELLGPLALLTLRQLFIHEHPAALGPFVRWSISQVMLVGDTLLVVAVALASVYAQDLAMRGELRRLPRLIAQRSGWWRLLVITVPIAYLGLVRSDPFADELALRPHAWIFQLGHVVFAGYVGARLGYALMQGLGVRIRRRRLPGPAPNSCPVPTGQAVCLVAMLILVLIYWGMYLHHPSDLHMTTAWLNFG